MHTHARACTKPSWLYGSRHTALQARTFLELSQFLLSLPLAEGTREAWQEVL